MGFAECIPAGLTDVRQDLVLDPTLELLGFGKSAREYEAVEAGFVDDDELLRASRGVNFGYILFIVVKGFDSFS